MAVLQKSFVVDQLLFFVSHTCCILMDAYISHSHMTFSQPALSSVDPPLPKEKSRGQSSKFLREQVKYFFFFVNTTNREIFFSNCKLTLCTMVNAAYKNQPFRWETIDNQEHTKALTMVKWITQLIDSLLTSPLMTSPYHDQLITFIQQLPPKGTSHLSRIGFLINAPLKLSSQWITFRGIIIKL